MTRKIVNPVCDLCGLDVLSEQRYRMDINQTGNGKGKFVKCSNSADMCHTCFLNICKNGFKPQWVTLVKNDVTGKWDIHEEQQKF
jgi:hypothetical protein